MRSLKINYNATEQIAYELSLDMIETTTGNNGYPQSLKYGLVGIDQYSDIEEIEKRYSDCKIIPFLAYKKEGWQLYERRQVGEIYEPLNILDFYTDASDCENWYNTTTEKELLEEFKLSLDALDTLEEASRFLAKYDNIYNLINELGDDEVLITRYLEEVDTYDLKTMFINYDSQQFSIGIFVVDKE